MKKENIKKNIATIALVATLVVGGTGIAIEESIDHTEEYCPFCDVLGMEHQVNVINNSKRYDGYTAIYRPEYIETTKYTTDAVISVDENGEMQYLAPSGYTLQGDKAVMNVSTKQDECIEVTDQRCPFDVTKSIIYKRK